MDQDFTDLDSFDYTPVEEAPLNPTVQLQFDRFTINAKAQNATTLIEATVDGCAILAGYSRTILDAEQQVTLTSDLENLARELSASLLRALPAAGTGVASPHQVPAPQQPSVPINTTPAPAAASVPATGGVFTVQGRYGDILTIGQDVFPTDALKAQAIAKVVEKFKWDPSHLMVFDDRPEYRRGHVGNIQFADGSPGQARLGKKALAWVDLNADGSLKIVPTRDLKDVILPDVDLQLALREANAAATAPNVYDGEVF